MSKCSDEYKGRVRIALAIEFSAILILIGLIFLAVAVSNGVAQLIITGVGFILVSAVFKSESSNEEKRELGLFTSKDSNSSDTSTDSDT